MLVLCGGSQLVLDSQPAPSAMCLRPTEIEGSVARDAVESRLRFPYQILCVVTGKDDAEVFLRSSRKARPTNLQSRFLEQICVMLRTILREGCILLPEFVRRELMRSPVKAVCLLAILTLGAAGALGTSGAEPANDRRSIVIVFKDGHRQSLLLADIARIEFKTPVMIVFKSGREQDLPATDIARIEFETSASALLDRKST